MSGLMITKIKFKEFKQFSACDLFSLTCGVLTGVITLDTTCLISKYYMQEETDDEIYLYVNADPSKGNLFT